MKSKKIFLIASFALLFIACVLATDSDRKLKRLGDFHKLRDPKLSAGWTSLHEGHWGKRERKMTQ